MENDRTIAALRDAVRVSPQNLPLRQALASALVGAGRHAEAEQVLKAALELSPQDEALKLALAETFLHQGKPGPALVIAEDLVKATDPPAAALLLHARLLHREGDQRLAARQYRRAVETDPAVADEAFAARLGLDAEREAAGDVDGLPSAAADAVRSPQRAKITFADVGGMEDLKDDIRMKVIHPQQHADLYAAYGKTAGGGILLYGPPGCGKTHLARATAGEIDANFISVGITDVLDMWIGRSERNLQALFTQARRTKPCVLFFDEVDALAASRADLRASAGRNLINQFLAEMDGINANNDGVLVLAATNAPWHVDAAFRRPGRFDRILFVPPPDAPARASILRVLLKGKPQQDIDHLAIATLCDGFSGADLKAVVDTTIEAKLKEAIRLKKPTPITTADLTAGAAGVKPSTQEWFATARNYATYSNQAGTYDDVLKYLKD